MHPKILSALNFVRLIDENGTMSISNIAVLVVLTKVAIEPHLDFATIAGLLTVVGNYSFKSYTRRSKPTLVVAPTMDSAIFDGVKADVERIKLAMGFRNVTNDNR
jgi:hypothetical protein